MKQLGLPISLNSKMLLSNFVGKHNQQLVSFVENLMHDKDASVVFVSGEKSTGKTHILQGCALAAMDAQLESVYIDVKQELPEGIISNLSDYHWVCIDNIENLNANQQQELFDLYNQSKQSGTKIVVSAPYLPNELDILKDLKTRLSLACTFTLESLNDAKKIEIIHKQMMSKNIDIDIKVYEYLFKHFSRDLNDILEAIDLTDKYSLQQKKPISIPFVKKVLNI